MNLFENPFYILSASSRDNRSKLMDLAEEKSLTLESDTVAEARSILTNPRKRIAAELSWLPEISPKKAKECLLLLSEAPHLLRSRTDINDIAKLNLLITALPVLSLDPVDFSEWVCEIARIDDALDEFELFNLINEERRIAGFPEITEENFVTEELMVRRLYFKKVIRDALDTFGAEKIIEIMTQIVDEATNYGSTQGATLIDKLVDIYEVEAQEFLELEENNIITLIDKLQQAAKANYQDEKTLKILDKLVEVVENWDKVAQPIQVSTQSRGISHEASIRVGNLIRSCGVSMFNDYGKLEIAQKITELLQEVFAEVDNIAEKAEDDMLALNGIAENLEEMKTSQHRKSIEWTNEITYEVEIGLAFKDKFRISPNGIEWKNKLYPLEDINRIRWGGIKHSINGIPTGTVYNIFIGTSNSSVQINIRRGSTYSNIIERLWKAVGIQLLGQYVADIKNQKPCSFSSAVIHDRGIELIKKGWFAKEKVFCPWSQIVFASHHGSLVIWKTNDTKLSITLPYLDIDNVHVLQVLLSLIKEKQIQRISDLF